MKNLPLDCLNTFFEEAKRSGVFELYYIDLSTGLRRGELLGLKWSDVDLNKGIIRIQRQILRQNGAVVEAPLKTKNSYRNIAIGTDTVELLWQIKQQSTSEYVFPSPTGGPISPDSVLHMLQRVLKRAGLEKIPFHSLRHTFSVLALQDGVDVKTLSAMLGHYSAGFTLGHLRPRYLRHAEQSRQHRQQLPLRRYPVVSRRFPVWVRIWVKRSKRKLAPEKSTKTSEIP
jgi:integrase